MAWLAVKFPYTAMLLFIWVQAMLFSLMAKAA